LWLYAATHGLGIGIAASVSYLLATGSFRHDVFVHLLASALVAVISYLISRWIVFPQPTQSDRRPATPFPNQVADGRSR
jgi:putative flippase GtrA